MARRSRGFTTTLTGPLLEGFMLLKGYGNAATRGLSEDETAKVVLTMIHLALAEKDQSRALAIVKGLVSAARSKKKTKKEEMVSP